MAAMADQAPLRTCPGCGREERTRWERCPHCGTSYYARPDADVRRRRRALLAAGLAGVVVVAVLAVVLLTEAADRRERDRADRERTRAALTARLKRIQAPHRGAARQLKAPAGAGRDAVLRARRALVGTVEARITEDALARARAGELDGPISHTECGPILRSRDAIPDDRVLSKRLGRYDCVAVKSDVRQHGRSVGRLGHPFVATLNFDDFTYVWCRNTPAQSERGIALVFVRLERACLAARGRAVGTGYVDVPGS